MQRLSSRSTLISKRVFPIFWFAFLAIFFLIGIFQIPGNPEALVFTIFPVIMAIAGFVVMKTMLFGLVDEVWDAGDLLVIRNKGEETTVRLGEIVNVSYSVFSNPSRVTLRLRTPGRFGKEISFIPVIRGWRFSKNAMIDELIDRIDVARRRSGT